MRLPAGLLAGLERELLEVLDLRDRDAHEPERAGPVGEGAVEEIAGELPDTLAVREPGRQGRRAAPDGEVRVAELRRHRARDLPGLRQVRRDPKRHPAELAVELLAVGDVAREGLLVADRDVGHGLLERPRVDPLRAVAEQPADLAREQPRRALRP